MGKLSKIWFLFSKREYNREKQKLVAELSKGKILDVGFNDSPNPFLEVDTGIDVVITKKPKNYKKCIRTNAEHFTRVVKEKFDTILACDVIEHLENPSSFIRECAKSLKDDGRLIITTPTPYYPPIFICEMLLNKTYFYKDTHLNMFPPRILIKLLEANGMKCDKILGCPCVFDVVLPKLLRFQILYVCSKK